jgi:hypothetical protein
LGFSRVAGEASSFGVVSGGGDGGGVFCVSAW